MHTRYSSNLPVVSPPNPSTSNPKRRNHRHSKKPFILEEFLVDTMADQRTMAELLHAPTEGYAAAIVVSPILAEKFELKHSLINMMTSDQFFGLEKDNPHDHIRWFNKITSTIKYKDVPNSTIKLMLFPFSLAGAARRWLEKEPPCSILTWEDLAWDRYKDLLRACPHHGFTELQQLDTFYNALNLADQDSLNSTAGGNLLERRIQDVLTIIKNKSKVRNSRNKLVVSKVKSYDANSNSSSEIAKLTHAVNQQMSACLAAGGNTFPELRNNIQGYVLAATVNYNQEQSYQAPTQQNQVLVNELEKVKRMNEANMKAMQTQSNIVKNELRNEMKNSIQASMSNQTNELKNMMASFFQMNTASTSGSGSLPRKTVANPKSELKAITTRSGLILEGPSVPTPPPFINPEVDERVEETLTDQNLAEYTIKVPPPPKLPEKLRDLGKFLISCGFSELKCKALVDLGASINLMPLLVWKKLGLPKLISTRMTLELANRAICTPAGIARDVFVLVGKFTFPADFVIVDYESDPRVPLILGIPLLQTARALIDVHDEEMILYDGDERLTLNIRHDTSSYSNQPQKESINLINVFNDPSEDFLEDLFSTNQPSGNPTFSSHLELTSSEVKDDIFDPEGGNVLPEKLLDLNSTKDLHPPLHVNLLSGSTTYSFSPNQLLKEFTDELALITFPLEYDDDLQFDIDNLANLKDNFVDSMLEMFTDEHALDYSSPLLFDEYDDDLFEVESDTINVYDDPFDSKGEKIKEFTLLIDELDLLCDFLSSEYDSFFSKDFSRVDSLPSTNNEDKDFDPPLYELPFFKEVPRYYWNLKNHAKGFCPPIFISSASLGNHVTDMNKKRQNPSKSRQNRAQNGKRGKVNSQ
nr:reverse transcriptase domain-containing protein [Tanacetum cinerariifolium]